MHSAENSSVARITVFLSLFFSFGENISPDVNSPFTVGVPLGLHLSLEILSFTEFPRDEYTLIKYAIGIILQSVRKDLQIFFSRY